MMATRALNVVKRLRPPPAPVCLTSTWRHVALRAAGADASLVGAALLAAEARRRRGLVTRERGALARRQPTSPLLRVRVRALERELRAIARTVERCKLAAFRAAASAMRATGGSVSARTRVPITALLNK